MLTAPEVLDIVNCVREDLVGYVRDLLADQQVSSTDLQTALKDFVRQVVSDSPPGQTLP
jgi:hypothetical protein